MKKLHLANAAGRDATVAFDALTVRRSHRLDLPDRPVSFRRYVAVAPGTDDEDLAKRFGGAYGQALVDDDPDADLEVVGRLLGKLDTVWLTAAGEVLYASPRVVELIFDVDGRELERREPKDEEANVNAELPVRWTGAKLPIAEAARRFVFARHIQLHHVDGLTYDYLFAMAKELAGEGVMVRLGAGDRGRQPLRFQFNGAGYQGFLEGRVDGERYALILHLTNLELKRPQPPEEAS